MEFDAAEALQALYDAEPENHLDDTAGTRLFDPPIFAVADAADPWFPRLKQVIAPFHWTPDEALRIVAPNATARRVIVWCLPISEAVRKPSYGETMFPSRSWAYARTKANPILRRMTDGLVARLNGSGFAAVAPTQLPKQPDDPREPGSIIPRWSLRHVGFVAGLGTFGISGGLITARGIAHRMSSVVTDADVPVTPRPYGDDPFAWCLRSSRGTCGACIERCPVGSVGKTNFERNIPACFNHRETIRAKAPELYNWTSEHLGCGLCQTNVPCESKNPTAKKKP